MTMTDQYIRQRAVSRVFLATLIVMILTGGGAFLWWRARQPAAFGLSQRVPWTTSKVVGTPEPPDPFMTERIFPRLKFTKPLDIAFAPGGNRVFIVEHAGKIFSFPNDNAVAKADLAFDVNQIPGLNKIPKFKEAQVFAMTCDPQFQRNHYVYICYVVFFPWKHAIEYAQLYPENKNASHVSRFTMSQSDPPVIDPKSEVSLLTWPGNGHNAGCLKFGPDGDLYIATGDNGDPNPPDPHQIGQNIGDLRAKILRIDVNHPAGDKPYSIPADNPFVNTPGDRGEVFAYGLRNPWKYSFDRATGEIWAADVGWELWESVYRIVNGGNYGWSIMEGPQPVYPTHPRGPTPIIPPAITLPHTEAASITGGFVYHGSRLPALKDHYIFGDWETRRLWAAKCNGKTLEKYKTIAQTDHRIVSFGEDADGELAIVDYESGGLFRIVPNPTAGSDKAFPRKLSETGLFADTALGVPNAGVIPFSINSPQWVDGSSSRHFIAVPSRDNVTDDYDRARAYPIGTVLVRTLSLPMTAGDATSRRNIETQLLHFDGRQWHAYAYQWDDSQTDATLVDGNGRDLQLMIADPASPGGHRQQPWHINSRAQCMTCHTTWTGYAMAFNEPQLDRKETFESTEHGPVSDNQVRAFRNVGLIPFPLPPKPSEDGSPPPPPKPPVVLVNPYDENPAHALDDRARSYLHVNCSACHRFGGGGTALIDLRKEMDMKETKLISSPMLGTFNLPDAQVVCPGDPSRSVLYYRMAKTGISRMPHLGSTVTDDAGLKLIARWISSLRDAEGTAVANQQTTDTGRQADGVLQALEASATGDGAIAALDKLLATPRGSLKLLEAMEEGRVPQSLSLLAAQRAANLADGNVRDLFARFGPAQPATAKVGMEPDINQLLAKAGDAERGHKVFAELGGGLCSKCHIIDGQGTNFGPDLSHIGVKYNKADLLDNILHPSKSIAQGFATYLVRTKGGEVYRGFVVSEGDSEIVLKDAEQKLIHVKVGDIDKKVAETISAMPEGLLADLEPQQAADLLQYLAGKK